MIDILDSGRDVVILSSRGGKDVATIANIPKRPNGRGVSIVGSLGWETVDTDGNSHIHPQFQPFQRQITGILQDVRERFFTEQLHIPTTFTAEPNTQLPTPDGNMILLQSKGYNDEYPEGINATFMMSMLSQAEQQTYFTALEQYYNDALKTHTDGWDEADREKLKQLCGFTFREGYTVGGVRTFDVEIRPLDQGAKAEAAKELLKKSDDPTRLSHFAGMPSCELLLFSGDRPEQDGPVMELPNVVGIWTRSPHDKTTPVPKGAKIVVESVSGNASLTKDIASRMSAHPKAA
jgi:hypothetical protein